MFVCTAEVGLPQTHTQAFNDQRTSLTLIKLYLNHQAMERDIETNFWQHGAQKLRKMAEVYRGLEPDQRLVELPQ